MLLRLISWPYFRRHGLRTALTATGIVLGVSVLVGMRTANESVAAGFSRTVERIAGRTELQVTAGEAGFSEDILEKVQAAKTVRVAVPVIEAIVDTKIAGQGHLLVLAIDMTGDRSLRDYEMEESEDEAIVDDPLIFLAQPDSIILSSGFAARNQIAREAAISLGTVEGDRQFKVRGIMKPSGLTSAFGGNLAIMDIYAAQKMFGRGRTFDRLDVGLNPGVTLAECQRELSEILGPAFEVQPPAARGRQFESMLSGYSMMTSLSSSFALFIGMFIIYNSFAMAVAERRKEIGILRALGATRGQIRGLFLVEGAALGLAGSVAGALLGRAAAGAIAAWMGPLVATVYGVAHDVDAVVTSPLLLAAGIGLGTITSVVAAAIPARQAAATDPVHALQKGQYQSLTTGEERRRAAVAAAFGVTALACLTFTESRPAFYAGYVCLLFAVVLLGPILSRLLAQALRPLLRWIRPVEGALAADSLIQSARRTSASVTALMLSLALVIAFDGMARASYGSIVDWMNTTLDPDLFVMATPNLDVQTVRLPSAMAPEVAMLPGVGRVQMIRNHRITFRGTQVMVVALEIASIAETAKLPPVAGDESDMYRRAALGEGLIVSESLAQLKQVALGDTLSIDAPLGRIELPVVGVVVDYSDQQGAILVDRQLFLKYWNDDTVNVFRVYAKGDVPVPELRQRILDRYAGERQVFVLTNDELKHYVLDIIEQWFSVTTIQVVVAVLVAILGIVNTLTLSITDRRRELGVLRAVGARHLQIRGTIWLEALSIAVSGLLLGYALGAVNLYYLLEMVHKDVAGMQLRYEFPAMTAAALVPIMLVAGFLAALWPAEAVIRGSLVEALEYE